MLLTHSGSGNIRPTSFSRGFSKLPHPRNISRYTLKTWHTIALYRSSNAKITSTALRASINNSLKGYWHFMHETKNVLMIRRSVQIVNTSGFFRAGTKGSRAWVGCGKQYMKLNFRFGPGQRLAGSGRVKFWNFGPCWPLMWVINGRTKTFAGQTTQYFLV
jgi:hypothetical protein